MERFGLPIGALLVIIVQAIGGLIWASRIGAQVEQNSRDVAALKDSTVSEKEVTEANSYVKGQLDDIKAEQVRAREAVTTLVELLAKR